MTRRPTFLFACALFAAGCGAAPQQAPATSPTPGSATEAPTTTVVEERKQPPAGYPSQPSPVAPMAPPAGAPAPMSAAPPPAMAPPAPPRDEATRSRAEQGMSDLRRAEQDIAAGDCNTACRALGSMERSVVMLCAMGASRDDADRCLDAKHRLVSARRRVQTSCGSCPGGPSVDPDAPIPSKR